MTTVLEFLSKALGMICFETQFSADLRLSTGSLFLGVVTSEKDCGFCFISSSLAISSGKKGSGYNGHKRTFVISRCQGP